ncbi:YybH family protein [Streptomyces formicae]|uniref:Ketosteroid isomerase-like protein n=1 Tax=Streptomyces formicae TaxID=1616117 RepID=A0A291QEG6_9ACTN|nr:nuclear transport factor 2 family protein [Streptomyces formicae]ATL30099.1 Ketosteroid isomerase-like protein [Streptomyces formicae]
MTTTTIVTPSPLPTRAEDVPAAFAERFNSGDADAVRELYEDRAAFVPESGEAVHGSTAISTANAPFLALGLPISVRPRQVHVAGDIALLVVDWEIEGKIRSTATDVARRGADGYWRYVIDSPFGAAPASALQ